MKLESVDKILNVSINAKALSNSVSALQRIISHLEGDSNEDMRRDLKNLEDFCGRLDKMLLDARDY
ncbi:hypothetical protein LCGC14_0224600 [marine sediment metagenome]|uniref:Uncharacterized protein n=1 Tax=marine sediment metagenome TaxID=412755 RepID=A0A0F9WWW8_9ZZZZ|nr:hypothetical protein [bacterium]